MASSPLPMPIAVPAEPTDAEVDNNHNADGERSDGRALMQRWIIILSHADGGSLAAGRNSDDGPSVVVSDRKCSNSESPTARAQP